MKIYLVILPLLSLGLFARAQDTSSKKQPIVLKLIKADPGSKQNSIESKPDNPNFPGGYDGFRRFINGNFRLPPNCANISGREIVTFYVETDGSLSNIHITKGISPDIDKESIRVMSLSPKWQPALKDGKPTRILYTIPIRFPLGS